MIKNRTHFALIAGIGFSLFSGLSHTTSTGEDDTALLITNPSAPARLGALALIHDDERFSVLRESGEINEIPNHLVARDLRGISQDEVKARLDNHINFRVQQGSDGEFSLQECGGLNGGWGPMDRLAEAVELASKNLQGTVGPAMATVSTAIQAHAAATTKLAAAPLAVSAAIRVHATATTKLADALEVSNQLAADNPTTEAKNEEFFQQVGLDYNTCLRKHPLEMGAEGIPTACKSYFNTLKMATDAMKMRVATRPIEEDTTQN